MPDDQSSDDWFSLDWQASSADYAAFVAAVFSPYITVFRPYRATLGSSDIAVLDFAQVRKRNWRYEVSRVYPVDYISDGLCRSAFGKTPKRCAQLLRTSVESAEVFEEGLLIRHSSMFSLEECDTLATAIRNVLPPAR